MCVCVCVCVYIYIYIYLKMLMHLTYPGNAIDEPIYMPPISYTLVSCMCIYI